ncbi:hypothetical protein F5Y03DRAFT_408816 [Xylaria venustula]|nr:hypothetical protein F5Y03DRAFT_408816 [Xylaria venustula]
MTALCLQSEYDPLQYWAAPARNLRSSTRLHLQHQLFLNTTGFLLDPNIETSLQKRDTPFKVADLGCGNGIWLTDLSHELCKMNIPFQLNGFDINEANFPPGVFLPDSVRLSKLNILSQSLPEEVIGAFDVVHVRAFSSIILNNDTKALLSACLALLKLGGWLQWEEMGAEFIIESAFPGQEKDYCETLAQLVKRGEDRQGMKLDFVREFGRHLMDAGFQQVYVRKDVKRKQDYKGWTEDFLMIWEEAGFFHPSKSDDNQGSVTRELWNDLFAKAVQETEKGVILHRGCIHTAVGRKPV